MPLAAAIRHVVFEDLGSLAPVLTNRGYGIRYLDAGVDDLTIAGDPDILIILGGQIGVNDLPSYPFLKDELKIIERRMKNAQATLGICLGAQLMAHVLGAKVYPGPVKEIGWKTISLSAEGKKSCLKHIGESEPILHWHGDTFDIPKSASLLASTDDVPHQAFSLGPNILGLQFHPEAIGTRVEQWLIGHTCELTLNKSSVPQIREDTRRFGDSLIARSKAMFGEWLDNLQTGTLRASRLTQHTLRGRRQFNR